MTNRTQGELSGEENHTLISTEMPAHNHVINGNNEGSSTARPGGAVPGPSEIANIYAAAPDGTSMNPQMVGSAGGSQPHNNMQPYLVVNFIIATQGIYPSRS